MILNLGISGTLIVASSSTLLSHPEPFLHLFAYQSTAFCRKYFSCFSQYIYISNTGTGTATNLSLILEGTNKAISNITDVFSTVDVTLAIPGPPSLLEINRPSPINSGFVELHVKKVCQWRWFDNPFGD